MEWNGEILSDAKIVTDACRMLDEPRRNVVPTAALLGFASADRDSNLSVK